MTEGAGPENEDTNRRFDGVTWWYHDCIQQAKAITIRIHPAEAHLAEIVARADGVSVNEVFRRALLQYFELKRADGDFVERAKAMVARDAEVVGLLR